MRYKKKVLKNGVRVLLIPMPESQTTTYMVWTNTGSLNESKAENGLSHFLEHMVFKGTKNRTIRDIRKEIDGIGAYNNAFTGEEYTAYYAKAHPKNLKKIINVISDMYLNPVVPAKDLEKERGVILGEIDMYEDDPMSLVQNVWQELTYGNQPAGRPIIGPKENIRKFQREDFLRYKEKHYIAEKTVVVVAGKFDQKEVLREIEKHFQNISTLKKLPRVKVKDTQKKQALLIRNKKTDQTHLVLGFRALSIFKKAKDLATLEVLNTILGRSMSSRLFVKVREELGLGYYVRSYTEALSDHGYLLITAGVDNQRLTEALKATLGEVGRLKTEAVLEEELQSAKRYFTGIYPMSLEQSDKVAVHYAYSEIRGKEPLNPKDVYKEIEKVTSSEVKKMANFIFKNTKMNLAIVGPHQNRAKLLKILNI